MDTTNPPRIKPIKLEFDIIPVATGRPRLGRNNVVFTPKKTQDFKKAIAYMLKLKIKDPDITASISGLFDKPICLAATFYMPIPQRLIKKNSEPWKDTLPTTKPDTDNLIKGVKDVLTGVIFRDDSQVTHESVRKFYSDRPGVTLIIGEATIKTWASQPNRNGV